MKIRWQKLAAFSLALLMAVSLLAGCTGGGSSSVSTPAPSGSEPVQTPSGNADREKVNIKFSQPNTTLDNTDKIANDPILNAFKEAVNIDITLDSTFEGYGDRMQTELTAGVGPDLFPNWDFERSAKWIQDGVVKDIGAIINAEPERYPILYKMINSPEWQMYNQVYSGDPEKTYALYALGAGVNWAGATLYNRDALEAAGYSEPPDTFDDFIDFATKTGASGISGWWPRNNKLTYWPEIDKALFAPNNTTVMAPQGDPWNGFMPVGGPKEVEGEWKLMTTSDETKEVLKIMAQLYKDHGIDMGLGVKDDFAEAKVEFQNGQIASFNHGFSNWLQVKGFVDEAIVADPSKTWEDYALGKLLIGPDGERAVSYSASFWMGYHWFIPDSCEYADRVLDFVEYLASNDGQNLVFNGVEGVHYTMEGDKVVPNADAWLKQGMIYNVEDGRAKSILFSYVLNAGQLQLPLEDTDDWLTAATNPIQPEEEDSDFRDYVMGIIDSYKPEAAGFLPAYFTVIALPAEYADVTAQLKEITLQYVPAFITGQKDIDAEWGAYVAAYENANAAGLEAAFNTAKDEAKALYDSLAK